MGPMVPAAATMWVLGRQLWGLKHLPRGADGKLDARGREMAIAALGWMQKHVLIYDFAGITHWQDILDTFRWAREHRRCEVFVIDSVMRIGIADDDYALQGLVAARMADFAIKQGAHLVEVIHQNKGEGSGKDRVRGSKQWTDNAHNVVEVRINPTKG